MENQYFERSIKEGSVVRTHYLSFDKSIKLEMLSSRGKKVVDALMPNDTKNEQRQRDIFKVRLANLRINGKPIVYEALGECFDSEEVMEVVAFVNDGDMTIFGGEKLEDEKN